MLTWHEMTGYRHALCHFKRDGAGDRSSSAVHLVSRGCLRGWAYCFEAVLLNGRQAKQQELKPLAVKTESLKPWRRCLWFYCLRCCCCWYWGSPWMTKIPNKEGKPLFLFVRLYDWPLLNSCEFFKWLTKTWIPNQKEKSPRPALWFLILYLHSKQTDEVHTVSTGNQDPASKYFNFCVTFQSCCLKGAPYKTRISNRFVYYVVKSCLLFIKYKSTLPWSSNLTLAVNSKRIWWKSGIMVC